MKKQYKHSENFIKKSFKIFKAETYLQSTQKWLVVVLLGVFLINFASSLEFDNVKSYDDKTQTVVIENAFGLGEKIAEIKLETPLEYVVPMGYQKVAEFKINSLSDEYLNALKEIEFQDIKQDYKTIDRVYDYKYWGEITEQKTNYSCGWDKEIYSCIDNGKYDYKYMGWIDFNYETILKGNYTIGIFTTVNYGDKVEWIPTFYGVKINEWASYVQSSGTVTTDGLYTVYTFTSNGYFNSTKANLDAQILVVAGGGGGGAIPGSYHAPGGGGGGGMNCTTSGFVIPSGNYVIEVGAGGNRGMANQTAGVNGSNSSIGTLVQMRGGGTGGGYYGTDIAAKVGGSGGGGINAAGAAGITNQGNAGGTGVTNGGGGGGGKDAVGANGDGTNGGNGGNGASCNVYNGTGLYYAGGGGGGSRAGTAGVGGKGQAGNGATGAGVGTAAVANTGSGGGAGGSILGTAGDGGNGGSGIVIIRVLTSDITATTPTVVLNSPIERFNSTNATVTFNATVTAVEELVVKNVSLYIDGVLNETNATGTFEGIYTFSKTLSLGNHNWSILAFNTNNVKTQSETRNFTLDNWLFAFCNTTVNTQSLNISFIDEATLLHINASIGSLSTTYQNESPSKSYTYSNSTDMYNYTFCISPNYTTMNSNNSFSILASGYPARAASFNNLNLNSTVQNKLVYLLSSADGIYTTFQVINSREELLSGVTVTATRTIDGSEYTIGSRTTDAAGLITFWNNPDYEHTYTFSKSGYTGVVYTILPTQSSYTVTMSGGEAQIPNDYSRGIVKFISPATYNSLKNDTIYDFTVNITSYYWNLSEFSATLTLKNGTIVGYAKSTTNGTALTISYNTTNQTVIYLDYNWTINGVTYRDPLIYSISSTEYERYSIKYFFTDLTAYMASGMFGLDEFGRYILTFMFLFLCVGVLGYKYGASSPITTMSIIFAVIFFLDVVTGFIPTFYNRMPNLLTFATGLILVVLIFKEGSTQ